MDRKNPDHNPYCMHYHTRWWSSSYYVIDASQRGNVMRFINHSEQPNIQPLCAVDRGILHSIFVARHFIPKGSQITFNYGPDYWTYNKHGKLKVIYKK